MAILELQVHGMFPGKVMISEHSPGMSFPGNIPLNWMTQLLEVKISLIARLSIRRSVDWLVGRSVCLSVIISLKSGKFHFHAPIGALVLNHLGCLQNTNCRHRHASIKILYLIG